MMKDWDRRYASAISLRKKTISDLMPYVRFESHNENMIQLATFPNELPMQAQLRVYDAKVVRIVRHGIEYRFALDEEAQELVDLFVELERNRLEEVISGMRIAISMLQDDKKKLQAEISNFITWKNVKAYIRRLFK